MKLKLLGRSIFIGVLKNRQPPPPKPAKQAKGDASAEFWRSFCHSGSIVVDCACGRINFANSEDAGDWEEGELERLRAECEKDPDKYISHPYDSVSTSSLGFIDGCTCGKSLPYEQFLINFQDDILGYYKLRRERKERELERLTEQLRAIETTTRCASTCMILGRTLDGLTS